MQTAYVKLLLLQHGLLSKDHSVDEYNVIMKVGIIRIHIRDHGG